MSSSGVLLHGAPAAGKDTITEALTSRDPTYCHFQRLKHRTRGTGRTAGYRLITADQLAALRRQPGAILYENHRYDAVYLVDRAHLAEITADGHIPVLHLGQPEAVAAITTGAPDIAWLRVELRLPRETAAVRIAARGTGDDQQRLDAYDATAPLENPDLVIDTSTTAPDEAARRIDTALKQATTP